MVLKRLDPKRESRPPLWTRLVRSHLDRDGAVWLLAVLAAVSLALFLWSLAPAR